MAFPQIVYDPGTGPITVSFSFQPSEEMGAYERDAIRHDSFTSSGLRQSMLERVDQYLTLHMDLTPISPDLPLWEAFIDFAATGASFLYYQDSSIPTSFVTAEWADTNWEPKFNFHTTFQYGYGIKKFDFKMRIIG